MQLKILQTLLPLITNYPSIHGPVLANALSLCFRLHDSKNMVVNGIASATLRQLVTHVFDKVAEEESHELGKGDSGDSILNLPPCTKDAYMLFQDLCLFSNKGETGLFLLKITSVSKSFVLELIEEILSSHHVLFKSVKTTQKSVVFSIFFIASRIAHTSERKDLSISYPIFFRQK